MLLSKLGFSKTTEGQEKAHRQGRGACVHCICERHSFLREKDQNAHKYLGG